MYIPISGYESASAVAPNPGGIWEGWNGVPDRFSGVLFAPAPTLKEAMPRRKTSVSVKHAAYLSNVGIHPAYY